MERGILFRATGGLGWWQVRRSVARDGKRRDGGYEKGVCVIVSSGDWCVIALVRGFIVRPEKGSELRLRKKIHVQSRMHPLCSPSAVAIGVFRGFLHNVRINRFLFLCVIWKKNLWKKTQILHRNRLEEEGCADHREDCEIFLHVCSSLLRRRRCPSSRWPFLAQFLSSMILAFWGQKWFQKNKEIAYPYRWSGFIVVCGLFRGQQNQISQAAQDPTKGLDVACSHHEAHNFFDLQQIPSVDFGLKQRLRKRPFFKHRLDHLDMVHSLELWLVIRGRFWYNPKLELVDEFVQVVWNLHVPKFLLKSITENQTYFSSMFSMEWDFGCTLMWSERVLAGKADTPLFSLLWSWKTNWAEENCTKNTPVASEGDSNSARLSLSSDREVSDALSSLIHRGNYYWEKNNVFTDRF